MASGLGPQHVSRVRTLYKAILRLHRGMPLELKALGDQFVKDEFRRHKEAPPEFVGTFMNEWTNYAITLAKQMRKVGPNQKFGAAMSSKELNALQDEQVMQLYELYQEATKPVNPENPLGENPKAREQSPDS